MYNANSACVFQVKQLQQLTISSYMEIDESIANYKGMKEHLMP